VDRPIGEGSNDQETSGLDGAIRSVYIDGTARVLV